MSLYLIEILHQTTTITLYRVFSISLYLIEILHQTTTSSLQRASAPQLYLIEILHQTTTFQHVTRLLLGCILSKFYIKPQQPLLRMLKSISCILSKFYIKPQHRSERPFSSESCILSKFYIKPQLLLTHSALQLVVSYRNSTSNHNVGPHID